VRQPPPISPVPSRAPPKSTGPPISRPSPPSSFGGGSSAPQARALYDFAAQQSGDLSFRKGDIITITKEDGNWWEGECNGNSGVFPANYVEKIASSGTSSTPPPRPNRPNNTNTLRPSQTNNTLRQAAQNTFSTLRPSQNNANNISSPPISKTFQ
jgi:hypothetical protein